MQISMAQISLHVHEGSLPVTLQGTVWGLPILLPQKPRLTGTMESLARMMAPRIAVATSLEHYRVKKNNKQLGRSPPSHNEWELEGFVDAQFS